MDFDLARVVAESLRVGHAYVERSAADLDHEFPLEPGRYLWHLDNLVMRE